MAGHGRPKNTYLLLVRATNLCEQRKRRIYNILHRNHTYSHEIIFL